MSNDTPFRPSSPDDGAEFRPSFSDPTPPLAGDPFVYVSQPRVRFQHQWWKHILLFTFTLITTTLVGADRYLSFLQNFGSPLQQLSTFSDWDLLYRGLWYSGTVLVVLGSHEMGHYIACRRYNVDATLPYFLPLYFGAGAGIQTGTLGAVIRIREMFPSRKALFDIGVAGPIAGFVVLVPALILGMYLSNVTISPPPDRLIFIGKPLLFRAVRWMVFGPIPADSIVNLHPMVWGAWFGMLATALNLLPFGQMDGGHITYATVGRLSTPISLATVAFAVLMTYFSISWFAMTLLMIGMLFFFGPRHPPVLNEYDPLGTKRIAVAIVALIILIICFTPTPIQL